MHETGYLSGVSSIDDSYQEVSNPTKTTHRRRRRQGAHAPPTKKGKYFSGNYHVNFGYFSGKYRKSMEFC